jgi:catechol 2,3-dioxygenase-like lactoylglutathione lyase family enzyme
MTDGHRLTHIGLCVRDIDRSTGFYCNALGFTEIGRMTVDDDASERLLDVPGLVLELVYLQRDGFRLELLEYAAPGTVDGAIPRPMNTVGFTHLSFRVDDPDLLVAAIVAHGGCRLDDRSVSFAGGNRGLMLTDPDGNLLELIERLSK